MEYKVSMAKPFFSFSGGGLYDEGNVGLTIKVGKWIEISEKFDKSNFIVYKGAYKNGKKVGRWHVYIRNSLFQKGYNKIGGGCYDEQGHGIKIGEWIDLDDGFHSRNQVTYHGEYHNGKKVGRWNAYWNFDQQIGGGQYDELDEGIKIGKWIELEEGDSLQQLIIFYGEYKHGKKVGRWDFMKRQYHESFKQIGGGFYDQNGIKFGMWIDLGEQTYDKVLSGNYQNGKKVGIWTVFHDYKEVNKIEYQN
ncbi:unnamed protein product [Paramecium pentaurelia]|uniref:MORN repeat protein n=1 Tax=Paramecium pentaurelia TaxID=43138 RepID=A0A8S1V628_9CILI|nr:unnamed protein product [Paramecium pentaurelia]